MINEDQRKEILHLDDVSDGHQLENGEIVYVCPICKARHHGEVYEKRKLYYNPKKKLGHCFVCEAVLVGEDSFDPKDADTTGMSFEEYITMNDKSSMLSKKQKQYDSQKFDFSGLRNASEIPELLLYLKEKRKLSDKTISSYVFKSFELKNNSQGIFIGSNLLTETSTDFFQIRNLDPKATPKYLSSPNTVKPIGYLDRLQNEDSVIICEGFFSALSASQHLNYKYKPLVLFGKVMTEFQEYQLNKFLSNNYINELICCLDGGYSKENLKLFNQLKLNPKINRVTKIDLPDDTDPNDLSQEVFLKCFKSRESINFDRV